MPFEVVEQSGPQFGFGNSAFMDGILDSLHPNSDQATIDRALFVALRRDMHKPVKAETVRKHFRMHWHLIEPLADREPSLFDRLIEEFHSALSDRA